MHDFRQEWSSMTRVNHDPEHFALEAEKHLQRVLEEGRRVQVHASRGMR